ncbi:relaxase/mobilization nuclease domain-containing protein [Flavobacterium sp. Sd200]|uniref:conjugal transfer protein MobB n=1 Tax=Flavobacterium sp. Sd200 TaxID=2692211 RepID=UPI0013694DBE|nr:conjugal transfer protein MobB [Flavobacterium sp. Sd200]MXN90947.1 relaxase/mobilization nuclease domain-containing protein [Flavobacterium sp. Sd200]
MVAKIGRGKSLFGALAYNMSKVNNNTATVLAGQKIIESPDGTFTTAQISNSFQAYLVANRKTEKPVVHISLNPDPDDTVNNNDYKAIAKDYMAKMGYGKQPFIVFKHNDIERSHIHIVTVCVDEQGRKISDAFEKRKSMAACRELERKYNLKSAVEKKQDRTEPIFKPVNYKAGDIKSQMAAVIRYLPKYYQYTTLGTYNVLLSLFNITAEEVKGQYDGKARQGLVYFTLNEKGEKTSNPFKASLFGKGAGHSELQSHFAKSKMQLQNSPSRSTLKTTIEQTILASKNEDEFKSGLKEVGINTVVRRTADNRIYGITFIDHQSRSVWNGSQLTKNLSAGVFNDWWNNGNKPEIHLQNPNDVKSTNTSLMSGLNRPAENEKINSNLSDAANALSDIFGGLLPQAQGEDYDEEAFARQMKKKSKGLRR